MTKPFIALTALLLVGCGPKQEEAQQPSEQGTVTDVSVRPEFEGEFVPGTFTYNSEDGEVMLVFDPAGAVTMTTEREDESITVKGRWERIFDGVSFSYRETGASGEPQTLYFRGLGEEDLTEKSSNHLYERATDAPEEE